MQFTTETKNQIDLTKGKAFYKHNLYLISEGYSYEKWISMSFAEVTTAKLDHIYFKIKVTKYGVGVDDINNFDRSIKLLINNEVKYGLVTSEEDFIVYKILEGNFLLSNQQETLISL